MTRTTVCLSVMTKQMLAPSLCLRGKAHRHGPGSGCRSPRQESKGQHCPQSALLRPLISRIQTMTAMMPGGRTAMKKKTRTNPFPIAHALFSGSEKMLQEF